jgi:nitrogen fixation protein NifQ
MKAERIYAGLMELAANTKLAQEDRHVLASIVAIAAVEAVQGKSLCDALGMEGAQLRKFLDASFPHSSPLFANLSLSAPIARSEEEACIRELLLRFRTRGSKLAPLLATLVARRAMRPNHLWQDLGFAHRGELSAMMSRHFAPLATRNRQDMKWKKFFYRMTCSEEGFSLCCAPVCGECGDFSTCFGDESGESLLARNQFLGSTLPLVQVAVV